MLTRDEVITLINDLITLRAKVDKTDLFDLNNSEFFASATRALAANYIRLGMTTKAVLQLLNARVIKDVTLAELLNCNIQDITEHEIDFEVQTNRRAVAAAKLGTICAGIRYNANGAAAFPQLIEAREVLEDMYTALLAAGKKDQKFSRECEITCQTLHDYRIETDKKLMVEMDQSLTAILPRYLDQAATRSKEQQYAMLSRVQFVIINAARHGGEISKIAAISFRMQKEFPNFAYGFPNSA